MTQKKIMRELKIALKKEAKGIERRVESRILRRLKSKVGLPPEPCRKRSKKSYI